MKKIKFLLPSLAFVIAIGGALVTYADNKTAFVTQKYKPTTSCSDCTSDSSSSCTTTTQTNRCTCTVTGVGTPNAFNSSCQALWIVD